jgi:hypothetical protein
MSSTGGIAAPDASELVFSEALIIGAGIIGLLIILVILRFGFNILLDVCVLGESARVKRSIAELWRKMCPCWHRRTQPEAPESENNVEIPDASIVAEVDRSVILDSILKSREVTAEDVTLWKEKHQHHTEIGEGHSDDEASRISIAYGFDCSICLNELNEGNMAITAKCLHVYHRKCLHQWVISRRTDCPNCRTEIVSLAELEYVLDQGSTASL